jgi:MoaA/NifB/PqqE/SkfB family radical SAM enzyme
MTCSFADEVNETRSLLATAWGTLPHALRGPTQFLGRHYAGCGATIGVMPRCDFTCAACYLGEGSNRTSPLPMVEVKAQVQTLRRWLGPAGNLQLTDAEITLRPETELIELIAYARAAGLVPMVMTHGETFRRKPGLLERLMTEGGLTEVCFHIDTTMRGRRDHYTNSASETDLNGLRAEFAETIRTARRRTGLRLEAASTVTVTRLNLEGIPAIVRWFLANADAFKMVSFQPIAAVGRTDPRLEAVSPDQVWSRIAKGADDPLLLRGEGSLGHPACGRFVQGLAVRRRDGVALVPLYRRDDADEMSFLRRLLDRVGGTSFRLDTRGRAIRRIAHVFRPHTAFLLRHGLPYFWRLARRAGTLHARYFCIASHHFMNATEIASPLGIERRSVCVFRVPIDGRLEPMCAVNAGGMRARFYESAEGAASPGKAA